ncbi:prolipoprotein diacylglyceryl transferase [Bacillus alkalicellulosilyticus]|uniref:prolipoprotein diacylglyceryl transferase n=1 Tax=Alkalihalobacterium alkalicellulosilyticum TaxID=1912214 RepID=UPI0009975F4C|nr:prolipoprotein diacylglyceryl transferase family protein [Bacillus alkalicellulosilyticus]
MTFPFYIEIGPLSLHPHFLFELLAYFIGFRLYLWTRRKEQMPKDKAIWVIIGAILGAAIGSKILYWFEEPMVTIENILNLHYLMEGKTIVGGLLGGLIGVEVAKKVIGWKNSTGDDIVIPLAIGMAIGRVGCFLTGLPDRTHGTPTTWVTGVNFGDGIARHPTQLYEVALLLLFIVFVAILKRNNLILWEGLLFQLFMITYLSFRFVIEFIKPIPTSYGVLNHIQIAAILGLLYYVYLLSRKWKGRMKHAESSVHHV